MNIALINAESRKAVSIIRSLGIAGHGIVTFSFEKISFAGCSKYVRKNYYIKNLDVDSMLNTLRKHGTDIIFPIEDSSIEFIGCNRDHFKDFALIIPDYEDFILFADKANTVKEANRYRLGNLSLSLCLSIGQPFFISIQVKSFKNILNAMIAHFYQSFSDLMG